jgi:DNA invertase Pin-like site-specific DNA recombinase
VTLFDDLRERKVNLVSLRDGLDLSTPAGRLMAGVLASVAAYETEVRAERIHAGLEVARTRGKHLGRPKGAGKGRRAKVTPEQETAVRRLKAEGTPVAAIARATGLSRPTVYSVLDATAAPTGGAGSRAEVIPRESLPALEDATARGLNTPKSPPGDSRGITAHTQRCRP